MSFANIKEGIKIGYNHYKSLEYRDNFNEVIHDTDEFSGLDNLKNIPVQDSVETEMTEQQVHDYINSYKKTVTVE
jgi:hypothetical protein